MRSEIYQFKTDDVMGFARFVNAKFYHKGNELVFKVCPYCQSTKDTNVFSVNLNTGQFQCKRASCGAKGNMITLSKDFGFSLGTDIDAYHRPETHQYKKYGKLHQYISDDAAVAYLQGRGISEEVANRYHITATEKMGKKVMVFPFTDKDRNLICIKYRKLDFDKTKDKGKEFFEKGTRPVLFGMEQCNYDNRTLIITEGQIDSLSLAEAGIENALSVPNGCNSFTWIPHCWDFIHQFSEIIVFGDCENGKMTLIETIAARFQNLSIKAVRLDDYLECKDANEILQKHGKEALRNAVNNAEPANQSRIISLSEVKSVDLENQESILTSFDEIDNLIGHGIPFGSLVIITGKRGEGKSTFASQIFAEVLAQGYKGFIYSGELPNHVVKAWLSQQVTGMKHLSEQSAEILDEWYKNKAYIYDNSLVDDERCDVENLVVEAIQRFDCRFLIIDNLMTAMDDTGEDIYRRQSQFTSKMARLTKKYNVIIFLVAHPRKNANVQDADSVSGSGDVTNLADFVISYERVKELPNNLRTISVVKNRLNGKLLIDDDVMLAEFAEDSRRIVQQGKDFIKNYGWSEEVEDGFTSELPEDIPFE